MKPDTSRWRSSSTYDYLDDLIPSDLAWEWLRRNAEYQRDYAEIERSPHAATQLINLARLRWGLRFPCPPRVRCHRANCVLGTGSRSKHGPIDEVADPTWPRQQVAG